MDTTLEQYLFTESCDPSCTKLISPYRVVCRKRYARSKRIQQKEFLMEHARLELIQDRALDGARIHREFCENILVPAQPITFPLKIKERLLYIMCNEIL